jgi:DNA repair protein RecO (recombination protein O)
MATSDAPPEALHDAKPEAARPGPRLSEGQAQADRPAGARRVPLAGRAADRVIDEPAFVLHSQPWRETSLIVELLTRGHGRIACVAKGAKRRNSALRGALLAFQPVHVSFAGRHELRTLTAAEWLGGMGSPQGDALLCAFYLNELLVRLLPRDDPLPALFDAYAQALLALSLGGPLEAGLRRFEWLLLRELGYAPDLQHDADSRRIDPGTRYVLLPGRGFLATDGEGQGGEYMGATLLDVAAEQYDSERTLAEAKRLTRTLLGRHLDGQVLKTRQILMDLHKL